MTPSTGVLPVHPSQGGFNTDPLDCWSRNSRKLSCLKDRGWLPGSSALFGISLPLTVSGDYVGRAGPETGRVDVLDQMQARTHTEPETHNTNNHNNSTVYKSRLDIDFYTTVLSGWSA